MVALCCTIFETFDVENYCDLEIQVRGHSLCEFMHDLYIAEIYSSGLYFYR